MTPSVVFVGAIATDFVFSAEMACSTSKRSRVYALVEVLVKAMECPCDCCVLECEISLSGAVTIDARWKGIGSSDSSPSASISSVFSPPRVSDLFSNGTSSIFSSFSAGLSSCARRFS